MPLTKLPYQSDNHYWRWRAFVREVYLHSDRREASWHVARLDSTI